MESLRAHSRVLSQRLVLVPGLFLAPYLVLAPAAAQFAIELRAGAEISFPHNDAMKTGNAATIEAWVRAATAGTVERTIFTRYKAGSLHKGLGIGIRGDISFEYAGSPWASNQRTRAGVFPFDGCWHHVAFVRHASGKFGIYVDGKPIMLGGPGPCHLSCKVVSGNVITRIGSTPKGAATWAIAALRVSTVDRYTNSFRPGTKWSSDTKTAMLLHFDKGSGTSVKDSGTARQVGTISGSTRWVPEGHGCFRQFGRGCGSRATVPTLSSPDAPRIGKSFRIVLDHLAPGSVGMLVFGNSATTWNAIPIPFDLKPIGMSGCFLYVSNDFRSPILTNAGTTTKKLAIPNTSSLWRMPFFVQAWAIDGPANALGVQTTNAGAGVIGR